MDSKRLKAQTFECPMCEDHFELEGIKLCHAYDNRKSGCAGPFCSKECAGRYSASVQHGKIEEKQPAKIVKEYTTHKQEKEP